jgi:hypothetical protein
MALSGPRVRKKMMKASGTETWERMDMWTSVLEFRVRNFRLKGAKLGAKLGS